MMQIPRMHRRMWIRLGVAAMVGAAVYPPWRYRLCAFAPSSRDVISCVEYGSHAPLWSRPAVPREMTQTIMFGSPRIDLLAFVLTITGIALAICVFAARFGKGPATLGGKMRADANGAPPH